ncbi:hypothetical protein [Synechococcus sp. BA-132 BA5]|uniref:hypothetical protein n=1 Tax=Synechococcus sp. BA-132 BA5 TaxID=3110252 RepID=UPI002B1FCD8D|nr:hypothetical protein [Synechococcus sp. BA-132 BA5]MEA5416208.1 hypothetical protein [Synechococcus sp. BA-132 BA5]
MPKTSTHRSEAEPPASRTTDTANPSAKDSPASEGHQKGVVLGAEPDDPSEWGDFNHIPLARRMEKGRLDMGRLLRSWITLNGWTYDDVTSIISVFSGGLPLLHGSQISNLIRGRLEPKPKLFVGLDYLNRACATNEKDRADLDPVISRKLVDVRSVASISPEKTRLWTAGDFLNYFSGLCFPPMAWLYLENLNDTDAYEYVQTFAKLVKGLADIRKRDYYPTYSTLVQHFPHNIQSHAMSVASGAETIPTEKLEQYLILYARGLSHWLGAEVTPWKLTQFLQHQRKQSDLPSDLYDYFVIPETIYTDGRKASEVEVEFLPSQDYEQACGEGLLDILGNPEVND